MKLEDEALAFWKVMQKFRHPLSHVGKVHSVQVEIPSLYVRAKNPRILMHLSNTMTEEGIEHDYMEKGA
jgi:hypothetical protein